MSKFNELVSKLREVFQIDRPELDFGIYRILNARAGEINEYLETRLKQKVEQALASGNAANVEQLKEDLKKAEEGAQALGVSPDAVPKVQELKQKIAATIGGTAEHENAVFSHLLTFFSRYYDKGDFISQRRYKGDTYAIPYAGEEVMLHWANKDQYYIKSGENFSNYSFKLTDGRLVHFRLIAADTAKDNRKDNDKDRLFVLAKHQVITQIDDYGDEYEDEILPIEEVTKTDANGTETKELIIRFEYKAMPKGNKQDKLVLEAVESVLVDAQVSARWLDLTKREPTEKNPKRTLFEKHLTNYSARNTADYFIHKNLGHFLSRELDFYIKNEVMHLDDVQNAEAFSDIEKNLRMIQCLRSIALDLVTFLAQIEDFQKKLWTKKKFVVSSHYCITLDRVPEELYPEIVASKNQWDHWDKVGLIDTETPRNLETLSDLKHCMIDTELLDTDLVRKLLSSIQNIDLSIDGLLIHSDNYQGLKLIENKYFEQVTDIYIDPPYNTNAAPIIYKNGYKESSWLTLIADRFEASKLLEQKTTISCITIDDVEMHRLQLMLEAVKSPALGVVAIKNNPAGRTGTVGFSTCHEYALFFGNPEHSKLGRLDHSEAQKARYKEVDAIGFYEWTNFRKHGGGNTYRTERPRQFYPIYVEGENITIPNMQWDNNLRNWNIFDSPSSNEIALWPIDNQGRERIWDFGADTALANIKHLKVKPDKNGNPAIYRKWRINSEGLLPQTVWDSSKMSAAAYGTNLLSSMFGESHRFSFPKSIYAVMDCLRTTGCVRDKERLVLDYFAGSGTTGHAVINLNRLDGGNRKYILIEQGEYFNTSLKLRLEKAIFSEEWKNGKPTASDKGISHCFKILKLESYEDSLNNLELKRTEQQQSLLTADSQLKDDYTLNYMLDVETRGSLLSTDDFKKPFDYKMKIAVDSAGAFEEQNIDLVETFNYLIGLTVKHIDAQPERGFVTVTGTLPSGETCLLLWRDCERIDYEGVSKLCDKLAINPADNEFDVVYINGDHNIPTVLTQTAEEGGASQVLKLRQIEPEFLELMFAGDDV